MNSVILRYVLISLIAIMVVGFSVGSWWVQQLLAERVKQTDHARIDAEIDTVELQQLRQIEKQLDQEEDIVDRVRKIAANSEQYKYQDQVISDVSKYAKRYKIRIDSFAFETEDKKDKSSDNKTPFTIALRGPLSYEVFLRFLRDLETNLTKMQVTSLTLSPDENPARIANPSLSLEVYIKK